MTVASLQGRIQPVMLGGRFQ